MLESISTPGGPGAEIILITGFASIVAFMICRRLFTRFDPCEEVIEQKKDVSSTLRYFGWSLPIMLSIAVFIIKVNYL